MYKVINRLSSFYDFIEKVWKSDKSQRNASLTVVITFLGSILLVQLNIWGLIPEFLHLYLPSNHFWAIEVAFLVLLFFEVLSIIFYLPRSVSGSLVKQLEVVTLIFLRQAFKEFNNFSEPITWESTYSTLGSMSAHAGGAVLLFAGIYLIRRMQMHKRITIDDNEQHRFIQIKKIIALGLLLAFGFLAVQDSVFYLLHYQTYTFFKVFYTILIFTDILIVLVSLRYSSSYIVLFRNSGFALGTVFLRIALTAPVYYNVIVGLFAVVFIIFLTFFYNRFRLAELKECDDSIKSFKSFNS